MNIEKRKKQLDYTKLNIGVELECFLVRTDSLREISRQGSQIIFKTLISQFGWRAHKPHHIDEIHSVSKEIHGEEIIIKIDVCYAIFEITTPPMPCLEDLERLIHQSLAELKAILRQYNVMIWPFGVAPASSGLFKLPFKHREEIIDDLFYRSLMRLESLPRFCHITAHQVNIDVPLQKLIPAINALYKNLGDIIEQFKNSPVYIDGRLYLEGRYYFWNDQSQYLNTNQYNFGAKPIFPQTPFQSLNDFFDKVWHGEFVFLLRNGLPHIFKDKTTSTHRFLQEKKAQVLDIQDKEILATLEKEDISLFCALHWLDFKPHFDLDDSFGLDEFLAYYEEERLDEFFARYCAHAYLEIRSCSPHFENNAMDIPRYFYKIFQNLDAYIEQSQHISWKHARLTRDRAIGYLA